MKIEDKDINYIIDVTLKIESDQGFHELLSFYPQGKKLTTFDFLCSLPEIIIMENESLYPLFKDLKSKFLYYKKKDYRVELNKYSKNIFNPLETVNKSKEQDQTIEQVLSLVDSFLGQCKIKIPDFYITIDPSVKVPYTNGSHIFLKYENPVKTASYIIHEIGHIIEINDYHLNNKCKMFLNSKNSFINEYIKKTYQNSGTEVFSIGLQMMFFSDIEFLFKDPFHFKIIYDYVKEQNGK